MKKTGAAARIPARGPPTDTDFDRAARESADPAGNGGDPYRAVERSLTRTLRNHTEVSASWFCKPM